MAGCPPAPRDPAVAYDDFAFDHSLWGDKVWPAIADPYPQFDSGQSHPSEWVAAL